MVTKRNLQIFRFESAELHQKTDSKSYPHNAMGEPDRAYGPEYDYSLTKGQYGFAVSLVWTLARLRRVGLHLHLSEERNKERSRRRMKEGKIN
jgi:hypothetical protein